MTVSVVAAFFDSGRRKAGTPLEIASPASSRCSGAVPMVRAEPVLRRERPDILGGLTVWLEDGRFIDLTYFDRNRRPAQGEAGELSEQGRAVFEEFGRVLAARDTPTSPKPQVR